MAILNSYFDITRGYLHMEDARVHHHSFQY